MATQFGTMKTFKQLKDLKLLSLFLLISPIFGCDGQESEELGSSGNCLPSASVPCSCASPCTVPLIMSPWLWRRDGSLTWRVAKGLPGFLTGQLSLLSILSPHMYRTGSGQLTFWTGSKIEAMSCGGILSFEIWWKLLTRIGTLICTTFSALLVIMMEQWTSQSPFFVGLSYNNQHLYSYSTSQLKNSFTFNSRNNCARRNN